MSRCILKDWKRVSMLWMDWRLKCKRIASRKERKCLPFRAENKRKILGHIFMQIRFTRRMCIAYQWRHKSINVRFFKKYSFLSVNKVNSSTMKSWGMPLKTLRLCSIFNHIISDYLELNVSGAQVVAVVYCLSSLWVSWFHSTFGGVDGLLHLKWLNSFSPLVE